MRGSCREIFREPPQKRGPSLKISRHPLIFQQAPHLFHRSHQWTSIRRAPKGSFGNLVQTGDRSRSASWSFSWRNRTTLRSIAFGYRESVEEELVDVVKNVPSNSSKSSTISTAVVLVTHRGRFLRIVDCIFDMLPQLFLFCQELCRFPLALGGE